MISQSEFLALNARSDQGYGLIVMFSLMLACGCVYLYQRYPALASRLPRISLAPSHIHPLALALLALVLRLPRLTDSFWYDETFTAAVVKLPLARLPEAILGDVHPPVPYLIQWLTARLLGTSEVALRLPALVCGVLLVLLVYRLALKVTFSFYDLRARRQAASVSGLIAAVLPAAIYYSDEARGYTLLACLALGAIICILEYRPGLFVVGALLPLVHNLGFVYLAVLVAAGLTFHRGRRWFNTSIYTAILGCLWLPGVCFQSADVANGFWLPPLQASGVLWYWADMTLSTRLPEPYILPTYIPVLTLTFLSIYFGRRWLQTRRGMLYLALVVGVPGVVAVISWLWRPIFLTRALLPCALGLVVLWAYLLTQSRVRFPAQFVTAAALGLALAGYFQPQTVRTPIREYLQQDCEGSKAAYYTGLPAQFMGAYYLDKLPALLWDNAGDLNQSLTIEAKAAFGLREGEIEQLADVVCLVTIDTPMTTQREREYVSRILSTYPHIALEHPINEVFHLNIYLVNTLWPQTQTAAKSSRILP